MGVAAIFLSLILIVLMTAIYMIVDRSRDRLDRSIERTGKHAVG